MTWSPYRCNDHKYSSFKKICATDMLTALTSSLEHPRNDVLRPDFFEKKNALI